MTDLYVVLPRGAFEYDDPLSWRQRCTTANVAIIEDQQPKDTGLLDATGRKLYRVPERVPFGFVK